MQQLCLQVTDSSTGSQQHVARQTSTDSNVLLLLLLWHPRAAGLLLVQDQGLVQHAAAAW